MGFLVGVGDRLVLEGKKTQFSCPESWLRGSDTHAPTAGVRVVFPQMEADAASHRRTLDFVPPLIPYGGDSGFRCCVADGVRRVTAKAALARGKLIR